MININRINQWTAMAIFALYISAANAGFITDKEVSKSDIEESQIGINLQGEANNIALALAAYVGIPYVYAGGSSEVSVKQEKNFTIADAIATINKQLHPNAILRITDSPIRMELAKLSIPTEIVTAESIGNSAISTAVTTAGENPIVATTAVSSPESKTAPITLTTASSPQPIPRWEVQLKDITLSKTFSRWATAAGYRMRWDAAKQVEIGGPNIFEMPFEDAITAALSTPGIQQSEYPLEVCFYPNTPPLVRVTRKGAQEKECK